MSYSLHGQEGRGRANKVTGFLFYEENVFVSLDYFNKAENSILCDMVRRCYQDVLCFHNDLQSHSTCIDVVSYTPLRKV
jgi:hypothetical protein